MAMIQTIFIGFLTMLQVFFASIFILPPAKTAVDYGGDPYVQEQIEDYLPIYENGESKYAIILADDADASVQTGAKWLQEFIGKMTGDSLDIYKRSEFAAFQAEGYTNYIALGNTGLDAGALDTELAQLKNEGFVKKVVDDNIYICGLGRGTMYGCSSFLEEQLGCRWFTPELKVIPENKNIAIDRNLNSVQNTALEYRDVYWQVVNQSPEWKAFHKINTGMGSYLDASYGYGVNYIDFCHTMERLVPADTYFQEYPEYFSWRTDQNTWTTEQRCLTNSEVLRITIDNVFAKIDSAPPDFKIMSVTQNDNNGVCQCANCLAKDAQYGGPSGTNIWFVNQVADAVKARYGDREIYIDTFAYDYTTPAPKNIVPRDNVIVRLCSIGSCFCHPIDKCGHSKGDGLLETYQEKPSTFAKDIEDWAKICNKLYVWDYTTNFKTYSMPFPNLQVLANNIQFFIKNNVVGLFEQGNYDGGKNGEFGELRAYLLTKLMWTPTANVDHLMKEFMGAYYGEQSAPYVREYLDLITRKTIDTSHLFIFNRPEQNTNFTTAELKKFDALWDKAEENAGSETQLRNIQCSRLSLRHYKANMVKCEFSLFNPNRVQENKKLFEDSVMLGMNRLKETEPMYEPYDAYVWTLRPIEWADPLAWVLFVQEDKVAPLDLAAYRAERQK